MNSVLPIPIRNTKTMFINEEPIKMTPIVVNRPQSPRQFFEKLYGHLETTTATTAPNSTVENENYTSNSIVKPLSSPIRSDISSSSDYIVERYINQ